MVRRSTSTAGCSRSDDARLVHPPDRAAPDRQLGVIGPNLLATLGLDRRWHGAVGAGRRGYMRFARERDRCGSRDGGADRPASDHAFVDVLGLARQRRRHVALPARRWRSTRLPAASTRSRKPPGISDELRALVPGGVDAVRDGLPEAWVTDLTVSGEPCRGGREARPTAGRGGRRHRALPGPARSRRRHGSRSRPPRCCRASAEAIGDASGPSGPALRSAGTRGRAGRSEPGRTPLDPGGDPVAAARSRGWAGAPSSATSSPTASSTLMSPRPVRGSSMSTRSGNMTRRLPSTKQRHRLVLDDELRLAVLVGAIPASQRARHVETRVLFLRQADHATTEELSTRPAPPSPRPPDRPPPRPRGPAPRPR